MIKKKLLFILSILAFSLLAFSCSEVSAAVGIPILVSDDMINSAKSVSIDKEFFIYTDTTYAYLANCNKNSTIYYNSSIQYFQNSENSIDIYRYNGSDFVFQNTTAYITGATSYSLHYSTFDIKNGNNIYYPKTTNIDTNVDANHFRVVYDNYKCFTFRNFPDGFDRKTDAFMILGWSDKNQIYGKYIRLVIIKGGKTDIENGATLAATYSRSNLSFYKATDDGSKVNFDYYSFYYLDYNFSSDSWNDPVSCRYYYESFGS